MRAALVTQTEPAYVFAEQKHIFSIGGRIRKGKDSKNVRNGHTMQSTNK